jgi:type I restriction enzyme M protein
MKINLPEWIKKRYLMLLDYFKENPFTFKQAVEFLNKNYGDSEDQTKVVLSQINQSGLLVIKQSEDDKREKIYYLKPLIDEEKVKKNNLVSDRDTLINLLKQAADLIRTRVDYTFILLLLFYKAYSDKWEKEYEEKKQELMNVGWDEIEASKEAATIHYHTFNFPSSLLWNEIRKEPQKISEKFSLAMKKLAVLNPAYQDIFTQFDFHHFTINPENAVILNQLIELFSKFSFKNVSADILGDAYEWILKYFAPSKAKEGEVYTPREVIRLMVEILDPKPQTSIYDPCTGSGGMLIVSYNYVEKKYGEDKANSLFLYGQEFNSKTLALAKMNMLLHGISNFQLYLGDTLLYPKFKEKDSLKVFDYVIANPPWNQDGYDEDTLKRGEFWQGRFKYGFTTKQSADWIWIQHMLFSTKQKVAVVIDTGAVSRGGREKDIRQKFVEDDLIEAVILLPEKIFYNTGAPAVIIVLNKNKPENRKNKILLINATKEFEPGKKQNTIKPHHIKKIVDTYQNFKDVEKFSKIITIEEAKNADYNLSPSRFISVWEEQKYRTIEEIKKDLENIEEHKEYISRKIMEILNKL